MIYLFVLLIRLFILGDIYGIDYSNTIVSNKAEIIINNDSISKLNDTAVTNTQDTIWNTVYEKTGASYYSHPYHGRITANGERYNHNEMTFARQVKLRKQFPFGTMIRVTNLSNGKQVIVRCNDTGPLTAGRSIDLSKEAMRQLDGIYSGVISVKIEKMLK